MRERGATLIEVMLTFAILGIVASALAAALFVSLETNKSAHTRVTEASSLAFASAYFVPDVESATTVVTGDVTGCALEGTPLVRFEWEDTTGPLGDPPAPRIASYAVRDYRGERMLIRQFCENGSPTGEILVAKALAPGVPSVVCDPSCEAPAAVRSVRMTIVFGSDRQVTLSGSRRVTPAP